MNIALSKIFCTLALTSCAIASAYLTYLFMSELGLAVGAPFIFALIGVTLDLIKTMSPTFIPTIAKQNLFIASFLALITISLMVVSCIASISAIEKGANQITASTKQNLAITEQIQNKKLELENLLLLSQKQISTTRTSKAGDTAIDISRVTDELNALYQDQLTVNNDSLLSEYSPVITLFISVSIEIVSLAMALALHSLNAIDTAPAVAKKEPEKLEVIRSHESRVKKAILKTQESIEPEINFAASVLDDVKAAILDGKAKPSYSGLKVAFGLSKGKSKQILNSLYEQGLLEPWNNGGFRLKVAQS
ncbi:hypothetical protein AFI02nite_12350 [Aliivibrio fischeri]|uniref:Uncharacterized protein n=2 Tax=Aliivibrio fischeri TaxID=668 RepID=A0A510UF76_ALIFS|nr:hypothetical protein AFI02nite_12350 [Aliivibrio fischeri]